MWAGRRDGSESEWTLNCGKGERVTNQQTVALQHTTCRDGHTTFTKSEEQKWKSRLTKEGNSPLGGARWRLCVPTGSGRTHPRGAAERQRPRGEKKKLLSFWDGKVLDGGGPCCVGPGDGLWGPGEAREAERQATRTAALTAGLLAWWHWHSLPKRITAA